MGTIYFTAGLFENVLRIIQESHDCLDVVHDLEAIQNTLDYGSNLDAARLDDYLRKKYPSIDTMLNIVASIPVQLCSGNSDAARQSPYKSELEQDRCGILCQVAIKKGLAQDLESCIDHVAQ